MTTATATHSTKMDIPGVMNGLQMYAYAVFLALTAASYERFELGLKIAVSLSAGLSPEEVEFAKKKALAVEDERKTGYFAIAETGSPIMFPTRSLLQEFLVSNRNFREATDKETFACAKGILMNIVMPV
jgi:hypothetical protein